MSFNTEPGRDRSFRWHIGVAVVVALGGLTACAPPAVSDTTSGPSPETSTVGLSESPAAPPASPVATSAAGAVPPLLEPQDLGPDWRIEDEVIRGDRGLGIVGNMCWQEYVSPSLSHVTGDRSRVLTNRPASVQGREDDGYKNCTLEPNTYQLTTLETGFAGDQALLVQFTYASTTEYIAWVAQGELVLMIYGELDRNLTRRAAVAAAARAR
jgi:hypothetical protein